MYSVEEVAEQLKEVDLKLNDVKEKMEQRKEQQEKEQKKGLFKSFFK